MPNSTPLPEDFDRLLVAAQAGDKQAFGQVYDHFFEPIFRYVNFRVNREYTEDIVETIFMKAWINLEKYEKRDVPFSAWLYRIAHNAIVDHHRTHRSILPMDPRLKDESLRAQPKTQAEKVLLGEQMREAVDQLPEPYRQVVVLKFLQGLSNREVAEILGEREGNVRVLQHRALKKLRHYLEDLGLSTEIL